MKKLVFFFAILPLFCFGRYAARYAYYNGTLLTYSSYVMFDDFDQAQLYSCQEFNLRILTANRNAAIPSSTALVTNDVTGVSFGGNGDNGLALYNAIRGISSSLVTLGFEPTPPEITSKSVSGSYTYYSHFKPIPFIAKALVSTNQVYQQAVLSRLSEIQSIIPDIVSSLATVTNNLSSIESNVRSMQSTAYSLDMSLTRLENKLSDSLPLLANDTLYLADTTWLIEQLLYFRGKLPSGNNAQDLVDLGFASSVSDAQAKLNSVSFKTQTLAPSVSASRSSSARRFELVESLKSAGKDPPPGKSWQNLTLPELESLYSYSYNTPASSNNTLLANHLPRIGDDLGRIGSDIADIVGKISGPFEVNVLNWPDNLFDFTGLTNSLADIFANLSFDSSVSNISYEIRNPYWQDAYYLQWRGFNNLSIAPGTVALDPDSVSTFKLDLSGDFFHDVPNLLMANTQATMDADNFLSVLALSAWSNDCAYASNDVLQAQYRTFYDGISSDIESSESSMFSHSNALDHIHFIDTSDIFKVPEGFTELCKTETLPEYVNFQFPAWYVNNTDYGSGTISVNVGQHRKFFDFIRNAFIFIYWSVLVLLVLFVFYWFYRLISKIPDNLLKSVEVR